MWTDVIELFQKYMGTGLIMIWFIGAVLYLFLSEKRTERRILFVYMPIILLLLYFNPLFAEVFCRIVGSEIYFRICWIMPIILVIAYAAVCIYERLQGKRKVIFTVTAAMLIAVSGKLVYDNPLYSRAENIYHMPDSVVHICDAIVVPGREVMAVFPQELLMYVRQYSPVVCMPYGAVRSDVGVDDNDFFVAMEFEPVELDVLAPMADRYGCHYVILGEEKEVLGEPEDYGWEVFGRMDGYIIYRNIKMPLDF